ncbi:NBR1-Ig-like domain-containing protein [Actinomadura rifamycini]|uniref:NBR1-Ig-like domain-containing protein n=1 Tax=Actinomadura rifamycini TaxID=31962 RepID=UPI00040A9A63|nr:NBR1-Ig-like domain-containing protein [Actinomadura rifamycini]
MHEATKGNKLPSWGTTAEFVKACGGDPAEYRDRWETANRTVRSAPAKGAAASADAPAAEAVRDADTAREADVPHDAQAVRDADAVRGADAVRDADAPRTPPPPPGETAGGAGDGVRAVPVAGRRGRLRPSRAAAAALATAAVGMGTVALVVVVVNRGSAADGNGPGASGARPAKAAPSPTDCPVRTTNPPPAPPLRTGDAATFITDVTLPDCTRVGARRTVAKVWRIKNSGSVPWEGYSLRRLDLPQRADQCQTISDVPIDDTGPGEMVDIRVDITTPKKPGLCYVRFKMVDSAGKVVFPGSRPVNFQVIVQGPRFPVVDDTTGNRGP